MIDQNNKKDTKTTLFHNVAKVIKTTAVAALLLPNLMGVSVAFAEEPQATENIVQNELGEPTEVLTLINVRAPQNMENYVNTLNDFENHPLILTNQVTGETFTTSIRPSEGNTSNNFQLATTVHAYERGNQPSGRYTITMPQELIDLGYSLTRDHSVQSNFGIVGTTTLSYNAPQSTENVGVLSRSVSAYDYVTGRNIAITLTTLDGLRSYTLGNSNLALPSGEYNIRISNSPTDSQPQLILRASSLVHAPEREIPLTRDGDDYVGTATFDFTNSTRPQIFMLRPAPLAVTHAVTIDPNGGTISEDFRVVEVDEGETYTVPYTFQSNLARPGYTLTGYTVEGTLLDANGNPVTELSRYTGTYTPMSDVTLTANWEVTQGDFVIRDSAPGFITAERSFALTDGETTYPLTSSSYTNSYREWRAENVPNGTYTLLIDGIPYPGELAFEKVGHPDTESTVTVDANGVPTFNLTFEDDSTTTFIRYRLSVNQYPVGVEVRDLNDLRTADVGVTVTNADGVVFEGAFDEYNLWTTTAALLPGTYTITLTTPEGTFAEINDTVASQAGVATDTENVFTLEVNAETRGSLSRVFGAFRLVEIPAPAPETDADHYEPVFVDEIVLNLNRGNGKLKNPKTLIENMNHMPGGFKIEYTNLDEIDLSGATTDQQMVEITVTYRDGSTDIANVPLRVIPK